MASGPEHYREAERLLDLGAPEAEQRALVHATLALAAAAAYPAVLRYCGDEGNDSREWAAATGPTRHKVSTCSDCRDITPGMTRDQVQNLLDGNDGTASEFWKNTRLGTCDR